MDISSCFELGHVSKTHGVHGSVSIVFDVDNPQEYEGIEALFVQINGSLEPFFIKEFSLHRDKAIVKFEDVDTIEAAEKLRDLSVYLPLRLLPKLDAEKGQFYFHDIVGYQVQDNALGKLGTVKTVYSLSTQDLLAMDYKEKEVLIPMSKDIILKADHANKLVFTDLPDGLLEIYLED